MPKIKPLFKVCKVCKKDLPISYFSSTYRRNCWDIYHICKSCYNLSVSKRILENSLKLTRRKFCLLPGFRFCIKCKLIQPQDCFATLNHEMCRICASIYSKEYRRINKDKISLHHKQLYKDNKEDYDKRIKEWSKTHKTQILLNAKRYQKAKRQTYQGKLDGLMATQIYLSLNGKKNCISLTIHVGFTLETLIKHIETQFKDGMSWGAYLNGDIEVDHIIPRAAFSYTPSKDEGFYLCWGLHNLRPEWRNDNRRKSDKLPNGIKASHLNNDNKIKTYQDYYRVRYDDVDNYYNDLIINDVYCF